MPFLSSVQWIGPEEWWQSKQGSKLGQCSSVVVVDVCQWYIFMLFLFYGEAMMTVNVDPWAWEDLGGTNILIYFFFLVDFFLAFFLVDFFLAFFLVDFLAFFLVDFFLAFFLVTFFLAFFLVAFFF